MRTDKFDGTVCDLWRNQARQDQLAWHDAQGAFATDTKGERRSAFIAGFNQGWAAFLMTAKIQGILKGGVA